MKSTANNEDRTIFKSNLQYYRRRNQMTQEELGNQAQLHRTHISALEKGGSSPSLDTITKLAKALNVEAWHLLCDRKKLPIIK